MKNTTTRNAPCFETGKISACRIAENIIAASDLCQLLSVSLPQLSRLQAKGIVFRQSQGKYYLAESVANYLAYKSAPRALSYEEALERAKEEGMADPVESALDWSSWKIVPSDDIETVRRRHQSFDVAGQVFEFQCELRMNRLNRTNGYAPEHFDIAAEETFQLMRRLGLNDSTYATFAEHIAAWDAEWIPEQDQPGKIKEKSSDLLRIARVAACAVAADVA
ncbi:MAG: hypothetical protein LBV12_10040 [Puniceicoccales bacterium]|jgi:hypothetical protein|nr:hypothetical protein [Puniceicoccales bacterium]